MIKIYLYHIFGNLNTIYKYTTKAGTTPLPASFLHIKHRGEEDR